MTSGGFHLPTTEQRCPECKETWFADIVKSEHVVCPYCSKKLKPKEVKYFG